MAKTLVKAKDVIDRQYSQSPIIQDMPKRMEELFGKDFLGQITECGRQLNPLVYSGDSDSYKNAVTARVDIGSLHRHMIRKMRRGDMIRDLMLNPASADRMRELTAAMPDSVRSLLSSFTDSYTPIGRVSDAFDATCILTFAAVALDTALMDFSPINPQDSILVREAPRLADSSHKVLIVAGPTAVGKDTLVDMFLKRRLLEEFHPQSPGEEVDLKQLIENLRGVNPPNPVDRDDLQRILADSKEGPERVKLPRDELFSIAQRRLGVCRLTKLTTRDRRPDEVDGVHYHFYDGGDKLKDAEGNILLDEQKRPTKDNRRPSEDAFLSLRKHPEHPLAYSYKYNDAYYGFAPHEIPEGAYHKTWSIKGLREVIESPDVKMLVLGGGTMPEIIYLTKLLPNATVLYVIPDLPKCSISVLERETHNRWWGRALDELKTDIERKEGTGDSGWPTDLTGFARNIERDSRVRFTEVTPQMTLALMCSERIPGFYIMPNQHGLDYLKKNAQNLEKIVNQMKRPSSVS